MKARPGHAQAVGRGPVETKKEAKNLRTLSRKDMIQSLLLLLLDSRHTSIP